MAVKRKRSVYVKLPQVIYYIPNFISPEEEAYLLRQVNSAPKPKWTQLTNRRLQNWGGLPHEKGMIPENIPEWLENVCKKISSIGVFGNKEPNHILVNEYLPGQGIMPHVDGPLYYPTVSTVTLGSHGVLDFYRPIKWENNQPGNCTSTRASNADVSPTLQGNGEESTLFHDRYMGSMLLERKSLFLMQEDMYKIYLHGIEERKEDIMNENIMNLNVSQVKAGDVLERGTRISLTIRVVPKVLKAKLFFGNKR